MSPWELLSDTVGWLLVGIFFVLTLIVVAVLTVSLMQMIRDYTESKKEAKLNAEIREMLHEDTKHSSGND